MRARTAERERARRLRAEGMSLRSIAAAVDASLSSVSVWVRGVPQPAPAPASAAPVTAAPGPRLYRWCPRCKAVIPTTSFNRSKGRWQGWCRPCFREYFAQRGDSHRAHVKRNKAARLRQGREHVLEILRSSQCADCGITDTTVLEFDHRGAKSAAVSALLAQACSLTRLKDEIAKCEVVCVNCHRRRTARDHGWRRARTDWRGAAARHAPRERRNIDHLYGVLEDRGCSDCGERDLVVLDFDHVGAKSGLVTRLAREGASRATLERELAECVVRCGNCHRRRTSSQLGHYRTVSDVVPPVGFEPTI